MAIDGHFAEAWLNDTHTVFGRKLRPFSIWHKLILRAADSPIFGDHSKLDLTHIYQAAIVCRLRYPHQPTSRGKLINWLSFLRVPLSNAKKESDAFAAYMEDYISAPEFWNKEGKDGSSTNGPPDELSTVTALMLLGFSEQESWDMPLGKASWYIASYSSWQGGELNFISEKERDLQKNWSEISKELDAKVEAHKKKMKEAKKNGR